MIKEARENVITVCPNKLVIIHKEMQIVKRNKWKFYEVLRVQ